MGACGWNLPGDLLHIRLLQGLTIDRGAPEAPVLVSVLQGCKPALQADA